MGGAEIFRKKANAKLRGVEGRHRFAGVAEAAEALMGGTWVGGEVVLTDQSLDFTPNMLNHAIQSGDLAFGFPLSEVIRAEITGGFGTKIITVSTDHGDFQFRCTKASDALAALQDAIAALGQSGHDGRTT